MNYREVRGIEKMTKFSIFVQLLKLDTISNLIINWYSTFLVSKLIYVQTEKNNLQTNF